MKKILFLLMSLIGAMSMDAQFVKLYKNGELKYKYSTSEVDEVVFVENPAYPFAQGQRTATGIGAVRWIQLWENGPKFADCNVGATSATEIGGYYTWGGKYKNGYGSAWNDDHNTTNEGTDDLAGTDDTVTALWGNNWRMPTSTELQSLCDNCCVEWTDNYNGSGLKGRIFTGRGKYEDNSVFFPAAGLCHRGTDQNQGDDGFYWASTPEGSDMAYLLEIYSSNQIVSVNARTDYAYPVRPVLAESTPFGQGEAVATGIGLVRWIQLWENGPKFAEYNVGATSGNVNGGYYTWGGIYENGKGIEWKDDHKTDYAGGTKLAGTDDTATALWGSNWRMPTMSELGSLHDKCDCQWLENYNGSGKKGIVFTGRGDYAGNSVFFPAAGQIDRGALHDGITCYYWSSNATKDGESRAMECYQNDFYFDYFFSRSWANSVRAVLAR